MFLQRIAGTSGPESVLVTVPKLPRPVVQGKCMWALLTTIVQLSMCLWPHVELIKHCHHAAVHDRQTFALLQCHYMPHMHAQHWNCKPKT